MTFYLLGGSDHSVLDTIAQLTEGRSARDQPKQPPAKKRVVVAQTRVGFLTGGRKKRFLSLPQEPGLRFTFHI